MGIKRYWIDAKGPSNREAVTRASEWMMSALSQGSVGLVVVPNLATLTGVFAEDQPVLARALEYHGTMAGGGATIALMTEFAPPKVEPNGPALVLNANMSMLNHIETVEGISSILALAWYRADVELWVNTWAAKRIPVPPPRRR